MNPLASQITGTWPEPSPAPVVQLLRKGSGTLDGLRPGRWKVELQGMNADGKERIVEVKAGETATVDF